MKDTTLVARLHRLGMPPARANHVAAVIRDRAHPVATVSLVKLREHHIGMSGMAGYEYDELSGLFKSIKKAVKKVGHAVTHPVGTTKKVVKKLSGVAAAVAPILPVAGVVAIGGAVLKAKDKKKKAKRQQAQLSASLAAGGTVAVPSQVASEADQIAAQLANEGGTASAVDIMRALLSQGAGVNMASPQAQQLLSDVAAQGVETTPEGPSSLPPWVIPVGAAAAAVLLLPSLMGRGRR